MAKQLLYETYAFVPSADAVKRLQEDRNSGKAVVFPLPIPGRLSVCDCINGNNRIYPLTVWQKNLAEDSSLRKSIKSHSAFGLLEHPKDGKIDLNSPISHILTNIWMEGKEVHGEITLVRTAEGMKLSALIEAGYNPLVSSRGYGSVTPNDKGADVVQDDFVCESWDCVHTPSFTDAVLNPPREEAAKQEAKELGEAKAAPVPAPAAPAPKSLSEGTAPAVAESSPKPASASGKTQTTTPMPDIKAITESVSRLRAVDPSKLDPKRFAEGLTQAQSLHRDVAEIVAEAPKLSYDGQRLHDELNAIEFAFNEAAKAPGKTVTTLKEQQTKTLRVLKGVAETALSFKGKLKEAAKVLAHLHEQAAYRQNKIAVQEKKIAITCAALDEMTRRYNEDTTSLGRRLIMVEFNPTDEAIKKRLNEAVKPAQLVPIRAELKKLTETAPAAKQIPDGKLPAAAAAKEKDEKKDEKKEESKVAPKVEAKTSNPPVPAATPAPEYPTARAFSVAESISLTPRLSTVLNG